MADKLKLQTPLKSWRGEKAVYHLVSITGDGAEHIAAHAVIQRLEYGTRRGFGSVKVIARIGETEWKTSVFPTKPKPAIREATGQQERDWWLLVSKKVMRAEDLAEGDEVKLELELL
ncbi:DUF1905 domain-containing protein [Altererythrobacter sp.]|uniref:DUF1905 domain-containing protein n=1 Tax=Altererythrobacter sp. TaxID=1872480 RepID=UPI001B2A1201|nr:DUF1905 domain-containing protein [Altererythrobacter sp.]MBO6610118.1 DUF1905 domain-containing protein [Altererythrobacter sp.]MBO6641885.1 DUF1905 domain-containing protein [Altererythrobacter sp.]MBO6709873.1 DUF1905 domain-containing protein [Altererythrobacter sp.]